MTRCAGCGAAMTVGGAAERSSPAGLVCGPCAGVVDREQVRAIIREALRPKPTPSYLGGAMPQRAAATPHRPRHNHTGSVGRG